MGMEGPIQESHEKPETLGIEFFVTDHSLRHPDQVMDEELYGQFGEMKRNGIDSIRFDWDWNEIMPEPETINEEIIGRYVNAINVMKEVGLKPPTLVLSSPPGWVMEMYKNDKEKFFENYEKYISSLSQTVKENDLELDSVQVFNEINNAILFKYVAVEDLPRITDIIKSSLREVRPNIKISTSLIVGNINDYLSKKIEGNKPIDEFLKEYEPLLKKCFDKFSIDYYPGVWHQPLKNPLSTENFKQLEALKKVIEIISGWQKECEIGEVGFPTSMPFTEERQRYFYDSFFRAFRQMLVDFKSRNISMPARVGIYEVRDEANKNFGGVADKIMNPISKIASKPNPEHNFGLKNKFGERKSILRSNRKSPEEHFISLHLNDQEEMSQLNRLINYVNRPIQKDTEE
jgi:hypothetical protein